MLENYSIGFKEEPKGLGKLLNQEGYSQVSEQEGVIDYVREDGPHVELTYWPRAIKVEDEDEVPNFEKEGFKVVSQLEIACSGEDEAIEEANRLSEVIVRKLDGIMFDYAGNDYFTKDDL